MPVSKTCLIYLRVSTSEQGSSGLGLAAQEDGCRAFAAREGFQIVDVITEIASGKRSDREALNAAIERGRKEGHSILVYRLDRLSRSLTFVSQLIDRGVPFVSCELGTQVSPFVVSLFASLAQQERLKISERTKDALQALKAKGVKLGSPKIKQTQPLAVKQIKSNADDFALSMKETLAALDKVGINKLQHIADHLNKMKVPARRGGQWSATQVRAVRLRLQAL